MSETKSAKILVKLVGSCLVYGIASGITHRIWR